MQQDHLLNNDARRDLGHDGKGAPNGIGYYGYND